MTRRPFVALLGAAAVASLAWPLAARAQQPAMPVVGYLSSGTPEAFAHFLVAFRQGLGEAGYVEGRNVAIEYRWANDRYDRLPELAAELVRRPVALLMATGGPVTALAAKAATSTIPIVFTAVADPVRSGLVASLNRPGGNITGTAGLTSELDPKRLQLVHQLVPAPAAIGVLLNPNRPGVAAQTRDVEAAARTIGRRLVVVSAGAAPDIDAAFETLMRERVGALLVTADPFFNSRRGEVIALAARHAIPAVYQSRDFASAGGLMSYGPSFADAYHQAGIYAGRILKGEKPADLPIVQPVKFELVLNLKTAKALRVDVPPSLLATADEVIE